MERDLGWFQFNFDRVMGRPRRVNCVVRSGGPVSMYIIWDSYVNKIQRPQVTSDLRESQQ